MENNISESHRDPDAIKHIDEQELTLEQKDNDVEIEIEPLKNHTVSSSTSILPSLPSPPHPQNEKPKLDIFEKFLTIWVIICMIIGTIISVYIPSISNFLDLLTIKQISLPIAVLIWIMIFPMTLNVKFESIKNIRSNYKPLLITLFCNWLVQPFLMFGLSTLFFRVFYSNIYSESDIKIFIAGAVILGGTPCTAMVFVWSQLVNGDPSYTLMQVATNDIIIFILFMPTLWLLLDINGNIIPYSTLALSIVLFVLIPFLCGFLLQHYFIYTNRQQQLTTLKNKFKIITSIALLLTLILIFIYQGNEMIKNPVDIILCSLPLMLQNYISFFIAYILCYLWKIPHKYAAPASMISASNFFELGVAMVISLYGAESKATLLNVVGVLVEVPVMLSLCYFSNRTQYLFQEFKQ